MPPELLNEVPFKKTHEALHTHNDEELQQLLLNKSLLPQFKNAYNFRYQTLQTKTEKKHLLRSFIYLDNLVAFYRLPGHIDSSPEDLSSKFHIPQTVMEHLLQEFTQVTLNT